MNIDQDAPWLLTSSSNPVQYVATTTSLASRISPIPRHILPFIQEDGLTAASAGDLQRLLVPAQGWLGAVPGLERLVLGVVGHIHGLAAEPGYDVSHSQPRWRDRVFVSCPERADDVGALRLAEGIVHEAMHLHLTNEEQHGALVAMPTELAYSPWRQSCRPVGGVLHGLFVFACIHRFLRKVACTARLAPDAHAYVVGRLGTIAAELDQVEVEGLVAPLTSRGRQEVAFWLDGWRGAPEDRLAPVTVGPEPE